jgi:predicted nucleic acid-binding protein
MSATESFFDTNVLLYLLSADSSKAAQSEALLADGGTISVQVLNEIASVASRKLGMSLREIREVLGVVRAVCHVTPISEAVHDRGLSICERYKFSIYDSMIIAAALLAECAVLFSEDLHDGQIIDSQLTIRDPFKGL